MNRSFKFFVVSVSIITLMSLTACSRMLSNFEQPTITLAGIEPLNMTLFEQTYRLKLRVQNPNDFDLPLEAVNYVVELNGKRFGHGINRRAVTIPAYASALVETEVISSLFSLFEKLQDFAIQGNTNMQYRLVGHIKVGGWGDRIPFEYNG